MANPRLIRLTLLAYRPALAFMFASTNLVFELGIVLWIFLGAEFTAVEFAGGLVLM